MYLSILSSARDSLLVTRDYVSSLVRNLATCYSLSCYTTLYAYPAYARFYYVD